MNYFTLAMTVLPYIMDIVQMLETQTGMSGPEKFAAAMSAVANKFPQVTQNPGTQTRIAGYINGAVELFNTIHPLFNKSVAQVGVQVPVAAVNGNTAVGVTNVVQ